MGTGLRYDPGPKLDFHVRTLDDVAKLKGGSALAEFMQFQADALRLTRARLRADKGLIGFVGGPFTLYVYAAAGSHEAAQAALPGLTNGVYDAFNAKLLWCLRRLQREAARPARRQHGAAVARWCGMRGAVRHGCWRDRRCHIRRHVVPVLADVLARFRKLDATTPVIYYSRGHRPPRTGINCRACPSSASHRLAS